MRLFGVQGDDLDLGYRNLRVGTYPIEREIAETLETMWARYAPYADADFVEGFAREPDARFWEMYIACALLEAGKALLPSADRPRHGGRPDICVVEKERRIWIEAIAPTRGEAPGDRIPELVPLNEGGHVRNQPKRQIQLRITSALWTKSQIVRRYVEDGTIGADDIVIVAVGAARFGIEAGGPGFPLALSALFPIGDEFVRIRRDTGDVVGRGYQPSFEIERGDGGIPRTAFLDEAFGHVSGLLWSRVSIGNMRRAERPLSLIHNPHARNAMTQNWGAWDREFVATRQGDDWVVDDILAQRVDR